MRAGSPLHVCLWIEPKAAATTTIKCDKKEDSRVAWRTQLHHVRDWVEAVSDDNVTSRHYYYVVVVSSIVLLSGSPSCLEDACLLSAPLSSISNSTTTQSRSLKVHIMHEKKQALKTKKREKKNYFKIKVTSNNRKSKLLMDCVVLQQRLCGF